MHGATLEYEAERIGLRHDLQFRWLLEVIPAAAYTTDAEGLITGYNQRAVMAWGRKPKLNDPADRY
jgi:PAS domain-containing protein